MPARPHNSFQPPPNPDVHIWRYMDIPKLVSFLMTRSLTLCRLSDLPDPFEGRFPDHVVPEVDLDYSKTEQACGRETPAGWSFAGTMSDWVRYTTYVNCWCCHEFESEALWRLFAHPSGVALTTRYSKLAAALTEDCYFGCVQYLDYEKAAPPPDNTYNLAIHKRTFFSHEHEARIVRTVFPKGYPDSCDLTAGASTIPLPIAFDAFEAVYVSPYSSPWVAEVVQDLLKRYGCSLPMRRSSMSPKSE